MLRSDIPDVKQRASRFMGRTPTAKDEDQIFPPATLYNIWHSRWLRSRPMLHQTIQPCAHEIALEESDRIIKDSSFKIKVKNLTIRGIHDLLQPKALVQKFCTAAPFMFALMQTFATSPNRQRKRKTGTATGGQDDSEADGEWEDEPDIESSENRGNLESEGLDEDWWKNYNGFSRNPVLNRATNILPLILGLFFKILGTSARVIQMLSNAGICVSGRTVERLKGRISEDTISLAVELIKSGRLFYIIFDNINIFLRKSQQRITNLNNMIHATNCAVIDLGDDTAAEDLQAKHDLRGKRAAATIDDIIPTPEDDAHTKAAFIALIADMLVRYAPDASKWKNQKEILEAIAKMMPEDRPLKVEKTDARPFGVFDVDEGSKKGIIKVLEAIKDRPTLSEEEWSAKVHIIVGDWLTSNNLRAACRDRNDDITRWRELDMLRNLALSGIMHCKPAIASSHKGLLHRTWDVSKPNYAAATALVRHSLIARLLHCVMVLKGMKKWSQLRNWRPNLAEIQEISAQIFDQFATSQAAEDAKAAGDDWLAHGKYFIHDGLMFCLFEHAVSHADAGRVIRVFKYWAFAFRGTGQHNYARECVEVIIKWKYELSPALRTALEKSWFVNRWGEPSRWIVSDLYLEQLNFWVKCVFIAQGNGVTVDYIMERGSACVEVFRDLSHNVARFFGDPLKFQEDMRVLVEDMVRKNLHVLHKEGHFVPAPLPKRPSKAKKVDQSSQPRSAIADPWILGNEAWQEGKFTDFLKGSTYDPALGYPISSESAKDATRHPPCDSVFDNGTVFDQAENPIEYGNHEDLHGDEIESSCPGVGGLGGGDKFSAGVDSLEEETDGKMY
ncbi:hypothetical protein HWV62_42205 [Athelia sp. TMB]|nr:hypothetical protein HWV62_42205 [Athelia sp. TMB]